MTEKQKKEYLEYFKKLEPLFNIINERSGQSWWSPPGEDWHFTCDMGYVDEFLEQLEEWLNNEGGSRYNRRKLNTILCNPPTN